MALPSPLYMISSVATLSARHPRAAGYRDSDFVRWQIANIGAAAHLRPDSPPFCMGFLIRSRRPCLTLNRPRPRCPIATQQLQYALREVI